MTRSKIGQIFLSKGNKLMSHVPENFFEQISNIESVITDKKLIVFLDYDGTLTPIVATPDQAIISDEMRELVKRLAQVHQTAVVSGRATDDVSQKVGVDNIYYAGSHGFEIQRPDKSVYINESIENSRSDQAKVLETLKDRLKDIEGVLVEDVKHTVSVHYRLVSEDDQFVVDAAVQATIDKFVNFKLTHGKKVYEIRPNVDWHKGKAVDWILNELNFDPANQVALYVGDDVTDEDAFAALEGRGFGVLVSEELRASAAKYWIKNPNEVKKVLEYLIGIEGK